jgi:hypothetical protein
MRQSIPVRPRFAGGDNFIINTKNYELRTKPRNLAAFVFAVTKVGSKHSTELRRAIR